MAYTRQQYWIKRSLELGRKRKEALCWKYRELGGGGGSHPVERWSKEEVVAAIVDMEWRALPLSVKLPDPPALTPPCDVCGAGQQSTAHRYGGDHHYVHTFRPDQEWVPESEAEAERLARLAQEREARP